MDEIIVFIIIWIIITVINQLSKQAKKKKEQEKPPPKPQTTQKPDELPQFLKNILGIPEEKPVTQTPTVIVDEEGLESYEKVEPKKDKTAEKLLKEVDKDSTEFIPTEESFEQQIETKHRIRKEVKLVKKVPKSRKKFILESGSLKKAIILKEILDKPTAHRWLKNYNHH
jgi:Na+-transporting methylmalonyl-CoA/oxaloacetate decarboxylase gamma subunit